MSHVSTLGMTEFNDEQPFEVDLCYPRMKGAPKSISIDLIDVRAAHPLKIEFDFDRDGWVISQYFDFDGLMWKEMAFVGSHEASE